MSERLGATLIEIERNSSGRIARYLSSFWATWRALRKYSPEILFAQNPSIVLAAFACLYCNATRTTLIVDAHNAGIYPAEGKNRLLLTIARWIIRNSDLTIVTTEGFVSDVERLGGNAIAIPDPLPSLNTSPRQRDTFDGLTAFFVCTWADDEPYRELILAAAELVGKAKIAVSGRLREALVLPPIPSNVELCGYLQDDEFFQKMLNSDVVIDLTYRDNCLVCGGYEAVALERPLLLSDTEALRNHFHTGTCFTLNEPSEIATNIEEMANNLSQYESDIKLLHIDLARRWQFSLEQLEHRIAGIRRS